MVNSFLVLVPHKTLHGTISILIQRPKLATNVGKMGAVKNKMPFIPQCPGLAQSAAAEMLGDGWSSKPTLFHWHSCTCTNQNAKSINGCCRPDRHCSNQSSSSKFSSPFRQPYEEMSCLELSAKLRMAARQWQTAIQSLCHMKHCMVPSASW